MDLTDAEIEELLALRALGIIDADDDRLLTEALDERPNLNRLLADMEAALVALDHRLSATPPPDLRRDLLAGLTMESHAGRVIAAPVNQVFSRRVDALVELLAELDDDAWQAPTPPYRWTVHGLVAHLAVIEDYTARQFGLITGGPPEAEHLDLGHEDIEVELTRSPRHTAERWTTRARATAAALSDSATPPDRVSLHGWPLGAHGAVVARSFELWTHTDDIRRALGRPVTTPLPEDLRTMSSFSVQGLPFTLALTSPGAELTPTRVVLTGPGGGTFDIGASGGGEAPDDDASTLIVVNVVDYCRVVARRLTIDDLDLTITGDQTLARSLLQSSSAFAL